MTVRKIVHIDMDAFMRQLSSRTSRKYAANLKSQLGAATALSSVLRRGNAIFPVVVTPVDDRLAIKAQVK
jgi:hypothetical protein